MLEALIRTKDSDKSAKCIGDVICIKLKELSGWGSLEKRVHQVVDWVDNEIEERMRKELEITGISPILTNPYKEVATVSIYDERGMKLAEKEITKTRSRKFFNINKISDESLKSKIIGDFEEVVFKGNLDLIEVKSEEVLSEEFTFNKNVARMQAIENKNNDINQSKKERHAVALENEAYLQSQLYILKQKGVDADVINGKIVRRAE